MYILRLGIYRSRLFSDTTYCGGVFATVGTFSFCSFCRSLQITSDRALWLSVASSCSYSSSHKVFHNPCTPRREIIAFSRFYINNVFLPYFGLPCYLQNCSFDIFICFLSLLIINEQNTNAPQVRVGGLYFTNTLPGTRTSIYS